LCGILADHSCYLHSQRCVLDGNGLMSAEEQSDESKHEQKKDWHVSDSFYPSPCQSTLYARTEYWRRTSSRRHGIAASAIVPCLAGRRLDLIPRWVLSPLRDKSGNAYDPLPCFPQVALFRKQSRFDKAMRSGIAVIPGDLSRLQHRENCGVQLPRFDKKFRLLRRSLSSQRRRIHLFALRRGQPLLPLYNPHVWSVIVARDISQPPLHIRQPKRPACASASSS